jgi:NADH-quinone oxidoreductase subunit J
MELLFYISAAVGVVATIMVITRKHPVHALLYLVASLLAVAMVLFSLGAAFAAALEVIVYAGAIMVLFVFLVMMLNLGPAAWKQENQWLTLRTWIGPGILGVILLVLLVYALGTGQTNSSQTGRAVEPREIGITLMGPYVLGVELASLLLLAALVGVLHLGRPVGEPGGKP